MIQLFGSFSLVANSWASIMSIDSVTAGATPGFLGFPICALTFIPSSITESRATVVGQGHSRTCLLLVTFEGPRVLVPHRETVPLRDEP